MRTIVIALRKRTEEDNPSLTLTPPDWVARTKSIAEEDIDHPDQVQPVTDSLWNQPRESDDPCFIRFVGMLDGLPAIVLSSPYDARHWLLGEAMGSYTAVRR